MARPERSVKENVAGDFYVDDTCIDCATCRWMAPSVFGPANEHSFVHTQPEDQETVEAALRAMIACPTGSIGTFGDRDIRAARDAFPRPWNDEVFHCGYHARESFGAASWFLPRPDGNLLVDSPRYSKPLIRNLEARGGIRYLFLTHADDVADHRKLRDHFGCERIIHAADQDERTEDVERVIEGEERVVLAPDLVLLPTPGHTRGSTCLLHANRNLFSGDHLAWSRRAGSLVAFNDACWYDWQVQTRSMERLAGESFEWVFPGHGSPCHFPRDEMQQRMRKLVDWMHTQTV